MESLQALFADSRYLIAAGGFVAAVIAAFVAGYVVGRAGRPRQAPPRPAHRPPDEAEPLPEMGGNEARLMDLTAIRDADAEPPPGPERPRRRR
ncbi:MAG TPA: hypothetical protein VIG69_13980 [Candidatus Methylomirabilis sp.]